MADNNVKQMDKEQDLNELLKVRRDKLSALQEAGKDPFTITKFDFNSDSAAIKADYEAFEGKVVRVAGRILARRIMGKASFVGLSD